MKPEDKRPKPAIPQIRAEEAAHTLVPLSLTPTVDDPLAILQLKMVRQEKTIEDLIERNDIAQLLITRYKKHEDEEAAMEREEYSRRNRDRHRTESEMELQVLLTEETKKYERILRNRNASVKNLTEAESGARCQGGELTARDGTIAKLKEQIEKVTGDSIKKFTRC